MTGRCKGWSEWTVRLVALLFLVQTALLAFSPGAVADVLPRDQFGNVLCLGAGNDGHGATHQKSGGHADPMACCSLACGMFASVVAAPQDIDTPIDTRVRAVSTAFISYVDVVAGVPEMPRITRGPPTPV